VPNVPGFYQGYTNVQPPGNNKILNAPVPGLVALRGEGKRDAHYWN